MSTLTDAYFALLFLCESNFLCQMAQRKIIGHMTVSWRNSGIRAFTIMCPSYKLYSVFRLQNPETLRVKVFECFLDPGFSAEIVLHFR